MMGVGNRNIEWIANDVDSAGRDRKVDCRVTSVNDESLMGFYKNESINFIGNMLLYQAACCRDFSSVRLICMWTAP